MKRTIGLVSIALVAVLTTACGKKDAESTAAANADPSAAAASAAEAQASAPAAKAAGGIIDVCSLVSLTDAESILGTPAKLSEHEPDDERSSSCHFDSVATQGVNNLAVEIHTDENVAEAKQDIAVQKQVWGGAEAVPGIGDDALLSVNKQPDVGGDPAMVAMLPDQQVLVAIKGARKIQIMTNYFGKPRPTDSLKALGKKLADGL